MSTTLDRVRILVAQGAYLVSQHGTRELIGRYIALGDLVASLDDAAIVEDYPDSWKGPSILVLQRNKVGQPVHVLWGLEKDMNSPAVLVTAYFPDAARWSADLMKRRP